jgi:hypothetical protein
MKLFLITLGMFAITIISCNKKFSNSEVKKYLEMHKFEWNISTIDFRWENINYYGQVLYDCIARFKKGDIKKVNTYVLKFGNRKDIAVQVLEFWDLNIANSVYEKSLTYAYKIRNTPRSKYYELCQPHRDQDFHYVYLANCKVILIGCINGNFVFENGDATLESNNSFLHEAFTIYKSLESAIK